MRVIRLQIQDEGEKSRRCGICVEDVRVMCVEDVRVMCVEDVMWGDVCGRCDVG